MRSLSGLGLLLAVTASLAQAPPAEPPAAPLSAEAIMARVAANQDRSEALRKEFVYRQHIHILTHKPSGKLQREETADYDVAPTPQGTEKKLKTLTGRYLAKGKYQELRG